MGVEIFAGNLVAVFIEDEYIEVENAAFRFGVESRTGLDAYVVLRAEIQLQESLAEGCAALWSEIFLDAGAEAEKCRRKR